MTHLVARDVDMAPKRLIWIGGDTHLYLNQLDGIKEQLDRKPKTKNVPRLKFNSPETDLFEVIMEDLEVVNYHPHPTIRFPMAAV